MFTSLDIEQFRGFAKLTLNDLGRVNLIVGKNDTGKTSLLEALTLLGNPRLFQSLPGLLRDPGHSFYRSLLKRGAPDASTKLMATTPHGDRLVVLTGAASSLPPDTRDLQSFGVPGVPGAIYFRNNVEELRVHAVSVLHRSPDDMIDAFADAVRAPEDERQMESLLQAVDSRIRTVRIDTVASKPFIVVDVGLRERIPLSQAGQGIYRLVAIFSQLLGQPPDICLIDEIENGIHYTALPTLWNGIAEVSARLGVQVFATTHSRECLAAAHETFAARDAYDLRVIQLYRLGDETSGRTLVRKHIEASIGGDIELR